MFVQLHIRNWIWCLWFFVRRRGMLIWCDSDSDLVPPAAPEKINQNRILACSARAGDKFAFAKNRTHVALLINARGVRWGKRGCQLRRQREINEQRRRITPTKSRIHTHREKESAMNANQSYKSRGSNKVWKCASPSLARHVSIRQQVIRIMRVPTKRSDQSPSTRRY